MGTKEDEDEVDALEICEGIIVATDMVGVDGSAIRWRGGKIRCRTTRQRAFD